MVYKIADISNLMSEPKCEYCGCSDINCLARCTKTGLYFCNGKGDTSASHIVHHLRTMHFDQITLPEQNPFYEVALKCYVCESTNVFQLGFLHTKDGSQIFIACRSKCQFDQSLIERDINSASFVPIISNGEILNDIVHVPDPVQYKRVPMSRVMAVTQAIKENLNEGGSEQPSKESNDSLKSTKIRYDSKDEFVDTMIPFVDAELDETGKLERSRSFPGIVPNWSSDTTCSFHAPANLSRAVSLGSYLTFSTKDIEEKGQIIKMTKSMYIDVKFSSPSLFAKSKTAVTVNIVFNSLPFERQKQALETFKTQDNCMNKLIANIILGQIDQLKKSNPSKKINIIEPPREYFPELNPSQIKCISTALSQHFTMIQGPPGTGKTTVIAVLALSLVNAGIKPVLVCCQSNVATDFATKRISQTGVKVTRVLSSNREQVDTDVDQYTTKHIATEQFGEKFTNLLVSNDKADKTNMTKIEKQIVKKSDVVCTTCTSAGGARLNGPKFEAVIFDESGQCVDPDLLIPLVHGCERAILVGDHKQLGPVIISRKSQKGRYDLPLMQRLILIGMRPSILKIQYRMHPGLSEFPSKAFYQGFLKDGVTAEQRTWPQPFVKWPNPDIPMFFWNIKHAQEEYYENGLSYVNRHEAGCISVLLDAMWKNGVKASDIGVITPYAGQQALLIDTLPSMCRIDDKTFFDEIEIASVDAFQGREKNFIILSNVRANDQYDIGFLKDNRRLCVSLTRAKYGLIVIGTADTFMKNKMWCKFIQHCSEKGVFVEGQLNDLKPSNFEPLVGTDSDNDDDDDNDQQFGGEA